MEIKPVVACPTEDYEKIFRHMAIFQPAEGPLVHVNRHEATEVAAAMEAGEGRLYMLYRGFAGYFAFFEVQDVAHFRKVFKLPSADGWNRVKKDLEEEESRLRWKVQEYREDLLSREWKREQGELEEDDTPPLPPLILDGFEADPSSAFEDPFGFSSLDAA